MEININSLPSTADSLKKIIVDLQQELHAYKEKYFSLIEQIRLARQQRFSSSSEKRLQINLFDNGHHEYVEGTEVAMPFVISPRDPRDDFMQKKQRGRRSLPKELPREVVFHDIPESAKICECGAHLIRMGEEVTEQLKYVPAKLSVLQHIRPKYACRPCQEYVAIAHLPKFILPKSIATPELVAHVIVAKYMDHLPLYRQETMWKRLEVDLTRSSLSNWILKVAVLCQPIIKQLQQNILRSSYIQADETTVQVLSEFTRQNTQKSYMWVFRGGDLAHPCIVYNYRETRGGYHAEEFLTDFKGYLQTDAYSGYNWACDRKNVITVGCMAHARRPFAALAKLSKKTGLAMQALHYFQKLYAIEKIARNKELSPEKRYELRCIKAPPILDEFKKWLEEHIHTVPEQHKMRQAMQYVLRHWENLTNYLKDGRIEIDNNAVENAIRPFALGRKNWLFAGSPSGAHAAATFYSLIETCKANYINPYHYLCTLFQRLPLCQIDDDYLTLLPQSIFLKK
ncbi:MAG: IS66 family transposase [Gammaproteobacteria bacterium]|nr:IS66 family transposase [Gammaproteobacteria bacterium]